MSSDKYRVTYTVKFEAEITVQPGEYDSIAEAAGDIIIIPEGEFGKYVEDTFDLEKIEPIRYCENCGDELDGDNHCLLCGED